MKKIKLLVLAVLASFFICSCNDKSGDYVEQMYTDSQKSNAFNVALNHALDTAFAHLCVYDGFYQYADAAYRIDFSNISSSVFDTLNNHQLGYLVDSLILYTNRMAESCNASVVGDIFTNAIDSLVYYDYDAMINGTTTALTDYLELMQGANIKSEMSSPVSIRMSLFSVNDYWNQIMNQYNSFSSIPVNVDLQSYIVDKMLDGFFEEMRLEEYYIRTDSTHQSGADTLLAR